MLLFVFVRFVFLSEFSFDGSMYTKIDIFEFTFWHPKAGFKTLDD